MSRLILFAIVSCTPLVAVCFAETLRERTIQDVPKLERLAWHNIRCMGIAGGFT